MCCKGIFLCLQRNFSKQNQCGLRGDHCHRMWPKVSLCHRKTISWQNSKTRKQLETRLGKQCLWYLFLLQQLSEVSRGRWPVAECYSSIPGKSSSLLNCYINAFQGTVHKKLPVTSKWLPQQKRMTGQTLGICMSKANLIVCQLFWRWRQEDKNFSASLGNLEKACLRIKTKGAGI